MHMCQVCSLLFLNDLAAPEGDDRFLWPRSAAGGPRPSEPVESSPIAYAHRNFDETSFCNLLAASTQRRNEKNMYLYINKSRAGVISVHSRRTRTRYSLGGISY